MASLSIEALQTLIKYDPVTGKLYWRERDASAFALITGTPPADHKIRAWCTRFADKEAFTTQLATGYLIANIANEIYYAHRVGWAIETGSWPQGEIDHVNGTKSDNRFPNLRDATREQNSRNLKMASNNTSGVTGVTFDRSRGVWIAFIKRKGATVNLGRFHRFDDAVLSRKAAEKALGFHQNHGKAR